MKVGPVRTVPLRASLHLARYRNAFHQRHLDMLERKYAPWAAQRADYSRATAASTIHPYPGLGHQLAGWISGYLWARDLGIAYTGGAVTRDAGGLFRFVTDPAAVDGTRVRLTSVLDERDERSVTVLRGQVNKALIRAHGRPVNFEFALDQPRWDQTPAAGVIREAVLRGSKGAQLEQILVNKHPYIAMHVRRGDVDPAMMGGATGHSRWIAEDWYVSVIRRLRENPHFAELEVRVYALGEPADFPLLSSEGVTLCLNRERDRDFIDMCAATILVVAPSSFSFTAGLASQGAVIARHPWWHHVPDSGAWVRADADGRFSMSALERALAEAI